jgi:F-type H+-transporting ATPase subunit epsilon
MELKLLTPNQSLADTTVQEVIAPGINGEFGVLPGHAAFLTELGEGRVQFTDASGKENLYQIRGGYAEVVQDTITILAEEIISD